MGRTQHVNDFHQLFLWKKKKWAKNLAYNWWPEKSWLWVEFSSMKFFASKIRALNYRTMNVLRTVNSISVFARYRHYMFFVLIFTFIKYGISYQIFFPIKNIFEKMWYINTITLKANFLQQKYMNGIKYDAQLWFIFLQFQIIPDIVLTYNFFLCGMFEPRINYD